jgi:hypothetical protein
MILKDFHRHPGLQIALAQRQGLPFLTVGLPRLVTRKARETNAYKNQLKK